jgi:hypothetical protein
MGLAGVTPLVCRLVAANREDFLSAMATKTTGQRVIDLVTVILKGSMRRKAVTWTRSD